MVFLWFSCGFCWSHSHLLANTLVDARSCIFPVPISKVNFLPVVFPIIFIRMTEYVYFQFDTGDWNSLRTSLIRVKYRNFHLQPDILYKYPSILAKFLSVFYGTPGTISSLLTNVYRSSSSYIVGLIKEIFNGIVS